MDTMRVRYFSGQFLRQEDFTEEQDYLRAMRHRHNNELHTYGIVEGLLVTPTETSGEVKVENGWAIDMGGKEIILAASPPITRTVSGDPPWYITCRFQETPSDEQPESVTGTKGDRRIIESANIEVVSGGEQPANVLVLAKITGNVDSLVVEEDTRHYSGMNLPGDLTVKGNLEVQGDTILTQADQVQGNVILGDGDNDIVTVEGSMVTGHSSGKLEFASPVNVSGELDVSGAAQVGGDLTVQGNLEVQGDTILTQADQVQGNVILGDEDNDTITVEGTMVTGHSSGKLEFASPVNVTGELGVSGAAQVGGDLTVQGNLEVQGDTILTQADQVQGNVILGDEDQDTITVEGTMVTGHSSGKLEIASPVNVNGDLSVSGNLEVQGDTILTQTDQVQGNVILGDEDHDTITLEGSMVTGHSSGKLEFASPVNVVGGLVASGTVNAAAFVGDGSGLTGSSNDIPITSVTAKDISNQDIILTDYDHLQVDYLSRGLHIELGFDIDQTSVVNNKLCTLAVKLPFRFDDDYTFVWDIDFNVSASLATPGLRNVTLLPTTEMATFLTSCIVKNTEALLTIKGTRLAAGDLNRYRNAAIPIWLTPVNVLVNSWLRHAISEGVYSYANAMTIDNADNIYIADSHTHRIQKYDTSGEFITAWGSSDAELEYFRLQGTDFYPHKIAFGPTGGVYIYNRSGGGFINKFDSSFNYISCWLAPSERYGNIDGISVGPGGDIFITEAAQHKIRKFDDTGTLLAEWGGLGTVKGQFNNPQGIAVSASAQVYVADMNNQRIQQFDIEGTYVREWNQYDSGGTLVVFSSPREVTIADNGDVYVLDVGARKIIKFNQDGTKTLLIVELVNGTGDGQFRNANGLVELSGNLYVADAQNYRIQVLDGSTGAYLGQWGTQGAADGEFSYIHGITKNPTGDIYVVDRDNRRIQAFNSKGAFLQNYRGPGTRDGEFLRPQDVETDSSGHVYVADRNNSRIQKFDSAGSFFFHFGSKGSGDGQFNGLQGVAVDTSGNIYVSDSQNHRIQKFNAAGDFLIKWGTHGIGDGQFDYPGGIAVSNDGHVFVCDQNNRRIQKFDANGQFLLQWTGPSIQNSSFYPNKIAVDANNKIFVIGSGYRIYQFDENGVFLRSWGEDEPFMFFVNYLGALASGSNGHIYVTDQKSVYEFELR